MKTHLLLLSTLAVATLLPSDAFAQRQIQCDSDDAKKHVANLLAKHHQQAEPFKPTNAQRTTWPYLVNTYVLSRPGARARQDTYKTRGVNNAWLILTDGHDVDFTLSHFGSQQALYQICGYKVAFGGTSSKALPKTVREVSVAKGSYLGTVSAAQRFPQQGSQNVRMGSQPASDHRGRTASGHQRYAMSEANVLLVYYSPSDSLTQNDVSFSANAGPKAVPE
jgi:hypothetical protein